MAGPASRRQVTDAPPGRYKVVERGRQLVVIDTRTGRPATRGTDPAPSSPPNSFPSMIEREAPPAIDDRSGHAVLTTSRLYDLKGPRRIVINEAASQRLSRGIGGFAIVLIVFAVVATLLLPWLWLLPALLLFQPKARTGFRSWVTARLDDASKAAS
jgi:hypothetical protein